MCVNSLKLMVEGAAVDGNKPHCLACRASAGQDVLDEKVSCKAVHGDPNLLGAEVVGEGVSIHRNDSPGLKNNNGNFIMGNILERNCPACTGVLPCAENQYCQKCYHGVHI